MSEGYIKALRQHIYEMYDGCCTYCGGYIDFDQLQIDHFIPRCQGGEERIENMRPSCKSCNASKGGRNVEQWRQAREWKDFMDTMPGSISITAMLALAALEPSLNKYKKKVLFFYER